MSHKSEVKTTIKNAEDLATLATLLKGSRVVRNQTIKFWDSKTAMVEVGLVGANGIGVGLVKQTDGTYTLVGDFQCFGWNWREQFGHSGEQVQPFLLREVNAASVTRLAKAKGYRTVRAQDEKGNIVLTLER